MKLIKRRAPCYSVLVALLTCLVGCATDPVQHGSYILHPEASIDFVNEPQSVGYGAFSDLLEEYVDKAAAENIALGWRNTYHVTPNVPYQQEQRFRECYGLLAANEPIYALFESPSHATPKNLGCHGQVFTDKGIHFNSGPLTRYYDETDDQDGGRNGGFFTTTSYTHGKYFIPYSTLFSSKTHFSVVQERPNACYGCPGGTKLIIKINGEVVTPDWSMQLIEKRSVARELRNIFENARERAQYMRYRTYTPPYTDHKIANMPERLMELLSVSDSKDILIEDMIPPKKLKGFKRCAGLTDEEITVFIDGLSFSKPGNGCGGMGFSDAGIYFHNDTRWSDESFPGSHFISYDQVIGTDFIPGLYGTTLFLAPTVGFQFFGAACAQQIPSICESGAPGTIVRILKVLRGDETLAEEGVLTNELSDASSMKGDRDTSSSVAVDTSPKLAQNNFLSEPEIRNIERRACSNELTAQIRLAVYYADTTRNDATVAYFWSMVAANNGGGKEAIAMADRARVLLSPQQAAEAFERLKDFALLEKC